MSTDTAFLQEPNEEVIDPALQAMLDAADNIEEAEEQIGRPPLPKSDYLVGYLSLGEFREVYDDKIPAVRVGLTVTEGIPGSVGKTYYDDIFLGWGEKRRIDPKDKDSELRMATDKEIAESREAVISRLKRFARVFGLSSFLPKSLDKTGVETWLAVLTELKENGPRVIFTGGSNKAGYSFIIPFPTDRATGPFH